MTEVTWSDIAESLRLEEVLEDLGIDQVKPNAKGWMDTRCPLPTHPGSDRNPSFGVNVDELCFNCYTCQKGGNIASLVATIQEISYEEALDYLTGFADVDIDRDDVFLEMIERNLSREREAIVKRVRRPVMPYFHPKALDEHPYASTRHLAKWDISMQCARAFGIRYQAEAKRGEYEGPALVIPHYFEGNLVGWQNRWLSEERPNWIPKYTNTGDFPKEFTLYNYDRAKSLAGSIVVVESVMTVMRLHMLEFTAVATFGAQVNEMQWWLLEQFPEITFAIDNDDTGRKTQKEAMKRLSGANLFFAPPPDHEKGDYADLDDQSVLDLMSKRIRDWELDV